MSSLKQHVCEYLQNVDVVHEHKLMHDIHDRLVADPGAQHLLLCESPVPPYHNGEVAYFLRGLVFQGVLIAVLLSKVLRTLFTWYGQTFEARINVYGVGHAVNRGG